MAHESDFMKGAQLVVEAMLQSPSFLFWNDTTPEPKLKAYAAASRLSYSLWDTMPDAALFAAAEHGDLSTAEGVEKQARRMLAGGKSADDAMEYLANTLTNRLLHAPTQALKEASAAESVVAEALTRITGEERDRQ